jgi:Bifunctional DNA primase/polymerase, N-terminal
VTGRNETAAQAYAAAGWPVFPLAPGTKVPAIGRAHEPGDPCHGECGRDGHGLYDATTDPERIGRWWHRAGDRNVAIATGWPGPDVVDVDLHGPGADGYPSWERLRREDVAGQPQAVVHTPSGGMHAYYPGTDQGNGRIPGCHLDFRSKGGYVVAPPSRIGGRSYVVAEHHDPATLRPVSWREVRATLEPPRALRQAQPARQPQDAPGSLDRLVAWVSRRGPGDRNFPLFWAAKEATRLGVMDGAAVERLVDAFAIADPGVNREAEARRSIESGRKAAEREARPFDREAG